MTFVSTRQRKVNNIVGDRKVMTGTYRFASVTVGNIDTGMQWCDAIVFTQQSPHIGGIKLVNSASPAPSVVGTAIPYQGTALPVTGILNSEGIWVAYGF